MLILILTYGFFSFVLFGVVIFCTYFLVLAVQRHFRSARVIWLGICAVHLIAVLAFEYYHPETAGNLDEHRFAEQFQWLSTYPILVYCFPSSLFSFALGVALNRTFCSVVDSQTCDSELAFVAIWWLIPVALGYLQWFKLTPWLLKKLEKRFPALMTS
jgi:hypothetical protein